MKTLRFFALATAAVAALMSCDPQGEDGYDGTNYIYLSTEGSTVMYESVTEPMVVDVMLTTSLEQDVELVFTVNDDKGVLRLENNKVFIKAGTKTGTFKIYSKAEGKLEQAAQYTVSLEPAAELPENLKLKSGLQFTVQPSGDVTLTEEQEKIVEAYKAKTGIDLTKYLGLVSVKTSYIASNPDSEIINPDDKKEIDGYTVIMLSDESTEELPVLKMLSNPMGIQDAMYEKFRSITVENVDWYSEYAPNNGLLLEKTGWTKDSEEIFSMSLDGIRLNPDSSVEFVGTGLNSYDEEITIVPFQYSFTAYDRELVAVEKGEIGPAYDPEWSTDVTLNPAYHLNHDDISEDLYGYVDEEAPEYSYDGNWVEASSIISDDELKFTFCMYHGSDYVYTKVVATYTPNE